MLAEMLETKMSQSIIISGESGAGKTQCNKQCLRFINFYFQHKNNHHHQQLQQSQPTSSSSSKVQKAIEISNPILQAFGNSKTIRNNNSSRFGKYLSIDINPQTETILHAQFYNYLLEKSRLISRAQNEQNFHIFYEFINNLSLQDKLKYEMLNSQTQQPLTFDHFNYLKNIDQSKVEYQAHPDVSFDKVETSIRLLPNEDAFDFVCRVLSAVLHLGNLEPYWDQIENRCEIIPEAVFSIVCRLLQVQEKELSSALTCYHTKIGSQTMTKYFQSREVTEMINSLAKNLYEKLFTWLIKQLNDLSSSSQGNQNVNGHSQHQQQTVKLGFLDIYGFEVLQTNSLQQLFINYTNERLHQIYLQKVFKEQKDLFDRQSLSNKYKQSDFKDNMTILELIDFNRLGIFNALDEWCSVASPDQSSFTTKIRYNNKKHENFPPSNFNLPSTLFRIKHTPKEVDYSVVGFREKNKDLLRNEIKSVMKNCSKLKNLAPLFTDENEQPPLPLPSVGSSSNIPPSQIKSQNNKQGKKFLSIKYRKQMNSLMEDLSKSQLHFIRCIKSNAQKKPLYMDQEVVFNQICYLGILDTIKIKKMGHCIKLKYETLDYRYKWLVRYHFNEPAFPKEIQNAIANFIPRFKNDEILYGKNMVFFKDYAYTTLVKKYSTYYQDLKLKCHRLIGVFIKNVYLKKKHRKRQAISVINSYIHPIFAQFSYKKKIQQIHLIQQNILKYLSHQRIENRKQNVILVQTYIKRILETRKRLLTLHAIEKVRKVMRKAVLRRKIQSRLVVNHIISTLLTDSIFIVGLKKVSKIQTYIQTLKVQISKSSQLAMANLNVFHIMQEKNLNTIEKYFTSIVQNNKFIRIQTGIIKVQSNMKGFITRKRFLTLKGATITIQKAWRNYHFRKKGSKDMFNETYKFYFEKVKNQNIGIQSFLYKLDKEQKQETIEDQYKQYLSKFKKKLSLLYFIIDFQSFVDLDITYPSNSWPLNYFRIQKQSMLKDNPIQKVEVGQSFCIATSTNRLYVWGMNSEFQTLDNYVQLKPKQQIDNVKIVKGGEGEIDIVYRGENNGSLNVNVNAKSSSTNMTVPTNKIHETIKKKYYIEAGRLFHNYANSFKPINLPNNQRVVQISCGSGHVVMRTLSKKVYTMGSGRAGQLGHGGLASEQLPRVVKFPQSLNLKNYYPLQVSTSFNSTIILFNNKKLIWFGSNGTIHDQCTPVLIDLRNKCNLFNSLNEFQPVRICSSWSRSLSLIGVTFVCFNGKMDKNITLRNKTVDLLIQKWHEYGIQTINPPYLPAISDHLEECHVKLPAHKVRIEPQSKRKLKEIEEKVRSIPIEHQESRRNIEFSFSEVAGGGGVNSRKFK